MNLSQHTNFYAHKNQDRNKYHGVHKYISLIFNSENATVKNDANNFFSVNLYNPIAIPSSAISAQVALYNSSTWNSVPNIKTGVNDKFIFSYGGVDYTHTIPEGLYSVSALNSTIGILNTQITTAVVPEDLFEIVGDQATSKVFITFNYLQSTITFDDTTVGYLLGFDNAVYTPAIAGDIEIASSRARMNSINSFLIRAPSLCDNGIPINEASSSILAQIPITSGINKLIAYVPSNTQWIESDHLIGQEIYNLDFYLTDENNVPVYLMPEGWSFSVSIRYEL